MKFDDDFKQAISNLPSKEKDKLILRLLKHDVVFSKRLFFELIEVKSVDELREELNEIVV